MCYVCMCTLCSRDRMLSKQGGRWQNCLVAGDDGEPQQSPESETTRMGWVAPEVVTSSVAR